MVNYDTKSEESSEIENSSSDLSDSEEKKVIENITTTKDSTEHPTIDLQYNNLKFNNESRKYSRPTIIQRKSGIEVDMVYFRYNIDMAGLSNRPNFRSNWHTI